MKHWFAPTHHDYLVKNHGIDPDEVPLVNCACGMKNRRADYMIDVTGLPGDVREALGISQVDYLCDGCTTRLFREQHIRQEDFNRLLGAPADNLARVSQFDADHEQGLQCRPHWDRPRHKPVAVRSMAKGIKVALSPGEVAPILPLKTRVMRHSDSVAHLQRKGVLKAPPVDVPIIPVTEAVK